MRRKLLSEERHVVLSTLRKVRLQEPNHRAILIFVGVCAYSYAFVVFKKRGDNATRLVFVAFVTVVVAEGFNEDHDISLLPGIAVGPKFVADYGGDYLLHVFGERIKHVKALAYFIHEFFSILRQMVGLNALFYCFGLFLDKFLETVIAAGLRILGLVVCEPLILANVF